MSSVTDRMLSRFAVVYGEPRTGDLEAFFAEYEKAMRGTHPDLLDKATDEILKSHEKRSWPTIGECRKAIDFAADELSRKARIASPPPQPERYPTGTVSDESRAVVRKLRDELRAFVEATNVMGTPTRLKTRVDRDAWNARRTVSVSRHGDPIRKGGG